MQQHVVSTQHRRAGDATAACAGQSSAHRGHRFALSPTVHSEHMRGWVAYGMSLPLPFDSGAEFRAGYAEHREHVISFITASDRAARVRA